MWRQEVSQVSALAESQSVSGMNFNLSFQLPSFVALDKLLDFPELHFCPFKNEVDNSANYKENYMKVCECHSQFLFSPLGIS